MATRLLLFGAAGQLGREIMRAHRPSGVEIIGLGRAEGDITSERQVAVALDQAAPRLVINAAAYTAVDRAESEPEAAFAANRDGPAILAEACRERSIGLIQISTDYVFDGTKVGAYLEDDPVAPLGVYGASKEAGERAVRGALAEHIILRTAWVFGAFGHNFVKTMLRLAAERDEVSVVDDQLGSPSPAADIAAAVLSIADQVLELDRRDLWGTYHFAGAPEVTWHGFAKQIFARRAMPGPKLRAITTADYPTPARRPANSVLDGTKLERAFDIAPADWAAGLDRMLEQILPHQAERQAQ